MPVTRHQAQLLAELAADLRPRGARRWDIPGIINAIEKVQTLALADVAATVVRAATDHTLDTPGAIGNTQTSAWRERERLVPAGSTTNQPNRCTNPDHGQQFWGPICPACRVDQLAVDAPTNRPENA